jgi:uncharacterized membrane protein
MFVRKVAVQIDRPVGEVFDYVADARNRPQWDEDVISEELTSPEPIGVGSTVRTRLRSMGREYEYTWQITGHERPRTVAIESTSGPFPTTLLFALEDRSGGTALEFSVRGSPGGVMRLLQPLIARNTQSNLERNFARLKQVLES